jgi:hypothetical protein
VVRVSEQTQIGPSVDATLWKRFREDVKERHGRVRGVLGKELETALRQHLSDDATPTERRLEQRLIRIEDELGTSAADGGRPVSEADNTHTHVTDTDTDTGRLDKPDPKAPRDDKVQYLAQCVTDKLDEDFPECPRPVLINTVRDEYGFRRDTAEGYVDELIDHFGLVSKPGIDLSSDGVAIYVTKQKARELLDEEADDRLDEVAQ